MSYRRFESLFALSWLCAACSQASESGSNPPGAVGGSAAGGSATGSVASGASPSSAGLGAGGAKGGATSVGGSALGSSGTANRGGAQSLGGSPGNGSSTSTSGGATVVGGAATAGGKSVGGASSKGGTASQGGASKGGTSSQGGASKGGTSSQGGSAVTGGVTNASGASSVAGGAAGATSFGSKRGIAANVAPGAEFYPSVRWWYNWAIRSTGANVGIEFVPMVWNQTTVSSAIPAGSKYLLGFNEPNFFVQANLSAAQSASYWPALQINANAAGVGIVGPGMNFCGPAAECHGTDPYQYLKDFFTACAGCDVDYVAVHWYNCDLASLRDYLEPGGGLAGFEQFGKPIWITEFSCDPNASVAQQEAYMRAAIPYLESNPKIFRYSWFSAGPIPNAKLINDDGTPTALGRVYISLPHGQ